MAGRRSWLAFLLPKGAKGMNIDDIADEAADAKA